MLDHLGRAEEIGEGEEEDWVVAARCIDELRQVLQGVRQVHEVHVLILPLVRATLLSEFDKGGVEGEGVAGGAEGGGRLGVDP